MGRAAECCDRRRDGLLNRARALLAGEGIGVASIDHQHPGLAVLAIGPALLDRGRGRERAREDAADRCSRDEFGHHQIGSALIAYPRRMRRKLHACHGRHGGGGLGGQG